jgi:hypothetical protein
MGARNGQTLDRRLNYVEIALLNRVKSIVSGWIAVDVEMTGGAQNCSPLLLSIGS